MKRKTGLILTAVVVLLSCLLAGCGVAPEEYDQMAAELSKALEQIAKIRGEANDLTEEKEAIADQLKVAQAKVAELEAQINSLKEQLSDIKEQYELVGATKAETAENIVKYYHKTHEYSATDLFICSDMASEVWNMLKAQGIDAVIMVGDTNKVITDILEANHAWVRAEVAPGEYLALETTAGFAVPRNENALYYRGWSFNSPAELKQHNEMVREYNVRVGIRNQIAAEDREVVEEYNNSTSQSTADKLLAVHEKLTELISTQEVELNKIKTELNSLATKCST